MVRYRKSPEHPMIEDRRPAGAPGSGFAFDEGGGQADDQFGGILTALYDRLSNAIAGGKRVHPQSMLYDDDETGTSGESAEGFLPDAYRQMVPAVDWFDPAEFARFDPANPTNFDFSHIPTGGAGHDGDGLDWFRSGEAPSNFANRAHPLYQARRDFAVTMAGRIRDLFDVSDQGSAGYLRPRDPSHDAPGGPSGNSDHYSGGAIDFFGSPDELTRLRNWLIEQPFTSFVRWQTESHYDHVHLSFDLGWVAKNYYGENADLAAFAASVNTAATTDGPDTETEPATAAAPSSTGGVRAE